MILEFYMVYLRKWNEKFILIYKWLREINTNCTPSRIY